MCLTVDTTRSAMAQAVPAQPSPREGQQLHLVCLNVDTTCSAMAQVVPAQPSPREGQQLHVVCLNVDTTCRPTQSLRRTVITCKELIMAEAGPHRIMQHNNI